MSLSHHLLPYLLLFSLSSQRSSYACRVYEQTSMTMKRSPRYCLPIQCGPIPYSARALQTPCPSSLCWTTLRR
ncbi:hypothetical protein EV421DRAFT_1856022 [Armillaria borealis]|uniref:Secreted protein n=1 Tax=Armillaria borealis TaxID=47425 RepID=A0AA39MDI9_9AGAR|nr:hypothetical protein EV421DRAFT_1856022 [Armillaria borealis]